ncbi:TPA: hypothetical protein ACU9T0_006654 [Burkholderia cenocepacia]
MSPIFAYGTTLERLEAIAGPGVAVLTIAQIVQALSIDGKYAVQSVRNRIAKGTFPIRSFKAGKLRVFSIQAVADLLDGVEPDDQAPPPPGARPVQVRQVRSGKVVSVGGRPTNAERRRRLGLAYGVLVTNALDDWLVQQQAREEALLRGAFDEAIADEPLPDFVRRPL